MKVMFELEAGDLKKVGDIIGEIIDFALTSEKGREILSDMFAEIGEKIGELKSKESPILSSLKELVKVEVFADKEHALAMLDRMNRIIVNNGSMNLFEFLEYLEGENFIEDVEVAYNALVDYGWKDVLLESNIISVDRNGSEMFMIDPDTLVHLENK